MFKSWFLLLVNASLVILNSAITSILVSIIAIFKLLVPYQPAKSKATQLANKLMWLWASVNAAILTATNPVKWEISGFETLSKDSWYLLISNHVSWADIVILLCVFKDRIPMPKFFLKQQLLYVPFVGLGCWAMDMPFMKRYSREYLLRHPEKRGEDLQTTRRACEKFKHTPTTVVNFVEGTRFTPEKQRAGNAEFEHLLQPKTGGIAYALGAMGEQFDCVLDVTLAYPDNRQTPFKDMLMGKLKTVVVRVNQHPVDESFTGDYFRDKKYKRQFQLWLMSLWKDNDEFLKQRYARDD